jgi:hypothetical protein
MAEGRGTNIRGRATAEGGSSSARAVVAPPCPRLDLHPRPEQDGPQDDPALGLITASTFTVGIPAGGRAGASPRDRNEPAQEGGS